MLKRIQNVQVCDPSAPLRTGCHASLKCRHERGTVKRAWQVKPHIYPKARLTKNPLTYFKM